MTGGPPGLPAPGLMMGLADHAAAMLRANGAVDVVFGGTTYPAAGLRRRMSVGVPGTGGMEVIGERETVLVQRGLIPSLNDGDAITVGGEAWYVAEVRHEDPFFTRILLSTEP